MQPVAARIAGAETSAEGRKAGAKQPFDLLIIGGGINGAGIARDAAGRGLKAILVEQEDLASATSSASSKLVHGGLRYLEQYEFRLVREALAEREVLLTIAPHIVRPLTFVLPHDASLRPRWMIRAGLFLYDHLAARSRLPASHRLKLPRLPEGVPLKTIFYDGFAYADCRVDDSRLVVLNALDARERGATIMTRTRFVSAKPDAGLWSAAIEPADGQPFTLTARAIINAAGPWVDAVLRDGLGGNGRRRLKLVKGSHIVVPRLYEGEHAYILQNVDRRVVFVIPFESKFSLIGTTDVPFAGDPARVAIDAAEVAYLCDAVNLSFQRPISPKDVVWSYAGVRPLVDDHAANPSTITRDYAFDLEADGGRPPVLSIFGGKITTYRRLAEHALEKLGPHLSSSGALSTPWTGAVPLPGGDIPEADFDGFVRDLMRRHPWLPPQLGERLASAYGTRAERILDGAASLDDLGADLGAGLTEAEVRYLVANEWARTPDDILWRRSKLGLHGGAALTLRLADWMAERIAALA